MPGCRGELSKSLRALDAISVDGRHSSLSMLGKECLWEVTSQESLVLRTFWGSKGLCRTLEPQPRLPASLGVGNLALGPSPAASGRRAMKLLQMLKAEILLPGGPWPRTQQLRVLLCSFVKTGLIRCYVPKLCVPYLIRTQ